MHGGDLVNFFTPYFIGSYQLRANVDHESIDKALTRSIDDLWQNRSALRWYNVIQRLLGAANCRGYGYVALRVVDGLEFNSLRVSSRVRVSTPTQMTRHGTSGVFRFFGHKMSKTIINMFLTPGTLCLVPCAWDGGGVSMRLANNRVAIWTGTNRIVSLLCGERVWLYQTSRRPCLRLRTQ